MVTIINTETPDAGAGNGSIPVGDIIKDSDTNILRQVVQSFKFS